MQRLISVRFVWPTTISIARLLSIRRIHCEAQTGGGEMRTGGSKSGADGGVHGGTGVF